MSQFGFRAEIEEGCQLASSARLVSGVPPFLACHQRQLELWAKNSICKGVGKIGVCRNEEASA